MPKRKTDNTMPKRKIDNRTNNYLQNTTQKTKDRAALTPLKTGGELRYSIRVSSFCSTSETCRAMSLSTCNRFILWCTIREILYYSSYIRWFCCVLFSLFFLSLFQHTLWKNMVHDCRTHFPWGYRGRGRMIVWVIVVFCNFSAISSREKVNCQWNDDDVGFVLDQHV